MNKLQYVGITGFTSRAEVEHALSVFPECGRKLMVGVLASEKTLNGYANKYPLRYPARHDIADIFINDPRCLNLVHYSSDNDGHGFKEEIVRAAYWGGPFCGGLQINMAWPDPGPLSNARRYYQWERIVLQLGRKALEEMTILDIRKRLATYVSAGTITDVLFDLSGGTGRQLDGLLAGQLLGQLQEAFPGLGFGVAGGLCGDTLGRVRSLIGHGWSIDAESALRDGAEGGGSLVPERVANYLSQAAKLIRSTCEHDDGCPDLERCSLCGERFICCEACGADAQRGVYHTPPECRVREAVSS